MIEHTLLFISAEPGAAVRIEAVLRAGVKAAFRWYPVETLFDGLCALQQRTFDVILSDLFLLNRHGVSTLRQLQQHAPRTPVVALVHSGDRDAAVTALRQGAYDFFCYDEIDPANLLRSFTGALNYATSGAGERTADRRFQARFARRLAISYQTLEPPMLSGQVTSETVNIGSKGLLFESDEPFQVGQLVKVSLDWPVRLENQVPLKLVATGRIVRNVNGQTAMTIGKYEFRTRRVDAKLPPALQ
jgi:DNA-binding NarL/FixJ family response regulator